MLALLRMLPLAGQLVAGGVVLAAIGGGYAYWHHKVYTSGYDAAIADVQAANTEGVNAALELVKTRRACVAGGGTWSQSRGVCE